MSAPRGPLDRVLTLLPAHVLDRDAATGGLLRSLLDAVAGELDLLERDTESLLASWFVETCPEWVVPYVADLLGVTDLPPDLSAAGASAGASRRAFVANTVAYRRRKGTPAVVEQVARDATGWPAHVVEYHGLLVATTHVNHVRLDRPATASVRTGAASGRLDLVPTGVARGALDPLAHTVDVRRIATGRGRHGIGNVGVHLFPDQVHESGWAHARPPDAGGTAWWVHPFGVATPLYAVPTTEDSIEHRSQEADLPVPLRPRRLLASLTTARRVPGADRQELPVAVRVGTDEPLEPLRLRVCGLEDLATDPEAPDQVLPGWQVMVDTVSGRLVPYLDGARAMPPSLLVRCSWGASADVGAGPYDRTPVHTQLIGTDPFRGDGPWAQVALGGEGGLPSLAAALAAADAAWADAAPDPGTVVVSVADSGSHAAAPAAVPEAGRLVVVAATWPGRVASRGEVLPPVVGVYSPDGLSPRVRGDLTVTGGAGSSVVLDGLFVEGDVVVGEGALGSLTVSQCTVRGRVRVGTEATSNRGVVVRVVRSVVGALAFGDAAAHLEVTDSVVDAGLVPAGGAVAAVVGAALTLGVTSSTLRGQVAVRTLEASSSILDGPVTVEHRQVGCVRYCFVEPGSRVPRRYRCVPGPDHDQRLRPVYEDVDLGAPHYLTLAGGCPTAVAEGGEGGSEMGVHHHLARPVRVRAARRLLDPFVPVGLEIGVAAGVATARS